MPVKNNSHVLWCAFVLLCLQGITLFKDACFTFLKGWTPEVFAPNLALISKVLAGYYLSISGVNDK